MTFANIGLIAAPTIPENAITIPITLPRFFLNQFPKISVIIGMKKQLSPIPRKTPQRFSIQTLFASIIRKKESAHIVAPKHTIRFTGKRSVNLTIKGPRRPVRSPLIVA